MPPELTLVVPTYNGRRTLPAVLDGLAAQTEAPPFEVVVVDDGSGDGTADWLAARRGGALDLRVLTQERRGPAAARNAGVRVARGPLVAFLGDDTVPAPGWLAAHRQAHRARRGPLAVVGWTTLHPRIPETPFLRWIYADGVQFGYGRIDDPEDLPFEMFYASNVSLAHDLAVAHPFDEAFPDAAWEDTELGYRLVRSGVRLVFEKSARLDHDHPTSIRAFCARQERAGRAAVVFYRRHPELGGLLGLGPDGPPPAPRLLPHLARTALVRLLEGGDRDLPGAWYEVLRRHYVRGLERGWRERFQGGDDGGAPRLPPRDS